MRSRSRWVFLSIPLLVFLVRPAAGAAVVSREVRFTVQNQNRSLVPCAADGQTYEVRGHLVAPATVAAAKSRTVTLYLHGLGYGEWFWRFTEVPGYDMAKALAERGHASVVIDRIGYDASGHPLGYASCVGAQADVAHQVIGQLRSGTYGVVGGAPVRFARVALAGHSAGGAIAQVEAYSFADVDALLVLGYADQGVSDAALSAFGAAGVACATGGEAPEPGSPSGYAAFGETDEEFRALMFHDAAPAVVAAASARRNLDPCGDDASLPGEIAGSNALLSRLTVPVLLACGNQDAIFPPPACADQAAHYSGTSDFTAKFLDGIGHALTLEKKAPLFRDVISAWLAARGF
jgi:pimeloyl-ACP methyl ester carboxylesterase